MTRPTAPQCVLAMGCYCAAHALGAPNDAPCNADEVSARAEWGEDGGEEGDPDYDPTPYETGEPENLPRESQERAAESMRYKR